MRRVVQLRHPGRIGKTTQVSAFGRLFDVQAHQEARLEHHHPSGRNRDLLAGLGIATAARSSLFDLEDPKVSQLDRSTGLEAFNDARKRTLQNSLHIDLGEACLFGDRDD